jgi:hypothetical protein
VAHQVHLELQVYQVHQDQVVLQEKMVHQEVQVHQAQVALQELQVQADHQELQVQAVLQVLPDKMVTLVVQLLTIHLKLIQMLEQTQVLGI